MGKLLHNYRPELHYMRGPGPKWHDKHRPVVDQDLELPPAIWFISAATAALVVLAALIALA
jgi:hypothetical protein